jgi:undecaprenyl-diphosphatase
MFLVLSLHTRVYGNWPGAGYLGASVLAAALFAERQGVISGWRWGRKLWPWSLGLSFLISSAVLIHNILPFLPIPLHLDRTATEVTGWREMGKKAGAMKAAMPNPEKTFLFGLRYQFASELAFYTPGNPHTVSINRWMRPNVYDYWVNDADILGWDAVGVIRDPSHVDLLRQVFVKVESPVELKIFRKPGFPRSNNYLRPVKSYFFCRAYGFKGGLRWVPVDKSDIRVNRGST